MDYRQVKYLDPKNDLTFRKIFGQHPNIMKSFLNSLLPLNKGQYIETLTYQDPALIPEIPELKHSVVDVRCTDNFERQFIVEMQMYWTNSFKSRMLFNAGKAYIKQIDRGHKYNELCPVYGLSLVDDIYLNDQEYKSKFYHHYRLAHQDIPNEDIKGIELIFIELPKFTPQTFSEKKMRNLWLRFLTEIDENTSEISDELSSEAEIREALEHLQISAFTKDELDYYDNYWDRVRIERSAIEDAKKKMKEAQQREAEAQQREAEAQQREAEAQQREAEAQQREAEAQQREAEAQQKIIDLAKLLKSLNISIDKIAEKTGLSVTEIKNL